MKKKRSVLLLLFVVLGLFALLLWWRHARPVPNALPASIAPSSPAHSSTPAASSSAGTQPAAAVQVPDVPGHKLTDQDKLNIGKIVQAFNAPIVFYGKVEDQFGAPVPDAGIEYSVANRYFGESTRVDGGKSDEQGLFSKFGMAGAGVYVSVFKEGYYGNGSKSARSFGYGTPSGDQPPSKEHPALFVLQKMGSTEPLIKVEAYVPIPRDGTPVEVSLRHSRVKDTSGSKHGDLRVEAWTDDTHKDEHRRYDWRCRVSILDGGFAERTGEFAFEAPIDGYTPIFEFAMPRTTARWTNSVEREWFLCLADGCFARIRFKMAAGGDHFFFVESYLNPKPGSRNLEFDPAKAITPKP